MLRRGISFLIVVVIISNLVFIGMAEAAGPEQSASKTKKNFEELTQRLVSTTSSALNRKPVEENQSSFDEFEKNEVNTPSKPAKSERHSEDKRRPKDDENVKSRFKNGPRKDDKSQRDKKSIDVKKISQKPGNSGYGPNNRKTKRKGLEEKDERTSHRGGMSTGENDGNQAKPRDRDRVEESSIKEEGRRKNQANRKNRQPVKVAGQEEDRNSRAKNVPEPGGDAGKSKRNSRSNPRAGRTGPVESGRSGAFDSNIPNHRGSTSRGELAAGSLSAGGGIPNNGRTPESPEKASVPSDLSQIESDIGPRQSSFPLRNTRGARNDGTTAGLLRGKTGKIPYYGPSDMPDEPISTGGQVVVTVGSVWIVRRCISGAVLPDVVYFTLRTSTDAVSHFFWRGIQTAHLWRLDEELIIGGAPFSRFDDSDPLAHDLRSELYDRIKTEPGTHLSSLAEETGSTLSTVRHHLRVLEREKFIRSQKVAGKRRLLPFHTENPPEQLAALADESTVQILRYLRIHGSADVTTIAEKLNLTPSTISHHLNRLETTALIEREREGQSVTNQLTQVAETLLISLYGDVGNREEKQN